MPSLTLGAILTSLATTRPSARSTIRSTSWSPFLVRKLHEFRMPRPDHAKRRRLVIQNADAA